jgi:hypothetical protein
MSAFQSGSITFSASAGALLMKTTAQPILNRFGFRRILIFDALISGLFLASYGFFSPATPIFIIVTLLLIGGFIRSLEFTSINAITYAEIKSGQMSKAVTFATVAQQLSLSIGIAAGAGALQVFVLLDPSQDIFALAHFQWAFIAMAAVSAASVLAFRGLPDDAGAEMAQRQVKGDLEKAP